MANKTGMFSGNLFTGKLPGNHLLLDLHRRTLPENPGCVRQNINISENLFAGKLGAIVTNLFLGAIVADLFIFIVIFSFSFIVISIFIQFSFSFSFSSSTFC